jgi:hypothetical protein
LVFAQRKRVPKLKSHENQLSDNQKYLMDILMATIAGLLASGIGMIAYALYPFLFEMHSDWLAIGVGVLVGMAVSLFGNGRKGFLGIICALLALGSCLAGDVLSAAAIYSFQNRISLFMYLRSLEFISISAILRQSINLENILLYGIALAIAYILSNSTPLYLISQKKQNE